MTEGIVVYEAQNMPSKLLEIAVSQNADIDKLEKLLDLQMRWEQNEARKAYFSAMSEFKKNPPEILKNKLVSFKTNAGKTEYIHATLDHVSEAIGKGLSDHGLHASWETHQNGGVSVTCKITHVLGHSEQTTLTAAPDTSGGKNSIQAIGSTVTYLERYTLLALTGLAARDQDNDGATGGDGTGDELISEKQIADIMSLGKDVNADYPKMLGHFKIEKIEEMTTKQYPVAVALLEAKRKK